MSNQELKNELPIRICDKHQDEYVCPTLFTFAFQGHERWCPYCGNKMGMWQGDLKLIPEKDVLVDRYEKYKKHYSQYLKAHGLTYADGTMYEGKEILPDDLPIEEKEKYAALRESGWKEKVKAEDI